MSSSSSASLSPIVCPTVLLNDGRTRFPLIGYGSYGGADDANTISKAVTEALKAGYTHIDCAQAYHNEQEIGGSIAEFLKTSGTPRSALTIVSKVWNTFHDPQHVAASVKNSIADLQCEYLDVLLMHWPIAWKFTGLRFENGSAWPTDSQGLIQYAEGVSLIMTWRAMESLVDEGIVKSIGVSNFTLILLQDLLTQCRIRPVINQVELHPYLAQTALYHYCNEKKIHLSAYSPLGRPARAKGKAILLDDAEIKRIAKELSHESKLHHPASTAGQDWCTASTVVLAWNVLRGVSVLPKSSTPSRIQHNMNSVLDLIRHFDAIDAELHALKDDLNHPIHKRQGFTRSSFMQAMDKLDRGERYVNHRMYGEQAGQFIPGGSALYE